jgi:hypothetical protein
MLLALIVAFLFINPVNAVVIPDIALNPSYDGYVTLTGAVYTRDTAAVTLRNKSDASPFKRLFVKFDLSSIPTGSTIISGTIYLRTAGTANGNVRLYPIANDPATATDANLYTDCGDGTYYLQLTGLAINTDYNRTLTAEMITDITAGISTDWWAFGSHDPGAGTETYFHSLESATPAYRPTLTLHYTYTGVTYTFTSHLEDGTTNYPETVTVSSSDGISTIVLAAPATYGFTVRPSVLSWDIAAGIYRRITPLASTGTIDLLTPEAAYSTFTINIRDYTGITQSEQTYLKTTRIVSGASQLVECVPITNTINGIPVTLAVNRMYDLTADTSTTDYTYAFYATTSTPSPVVLLDTLTFSEVFQYNSRFIHAEATRPTYTSLHVDYDDDLLDTTLVQIRILNPAGALVQSHNETADSFAWTSAPVTSGIQYQVLLWITHGDLGNLIYSKTFSGLFSYADPPDLAGLGTFGAVDMSQVFGSVIIVIFAGLFGARNAVAGAILTCMLTALLTLIGWVSINSGVIVLALMTAVVFGLGRGT